MIQLFTMNDYDEVLELWRRTPGVGLRSMDDSREGIEQFLLRNPNTNFISTTDGQINGVALSGHDGRRGYLYHVCVDDNYRHKSIGRQLIEYVTEAMKSEKITKLALICYSENIPGNKFWSSLGWTKLADLNYYDLSMNKDNK